MSVEKFKASAYSLQKEREKKSYVLASTKGYWLGEIGVPIQARLPFTGHTWAEKKGNDLTRGLLNNFFLYKVLN